MDWMDWMDWILLRSLVLLEHLAVLKNGCIKEEEEKRMYSLTPADAGIIPSARAA